jgi:hypothetical protein
MCTRTSYIPQGATSSRRQADRSRRASWCHNTSVVGALLASAFHEVWVADAADYARSPLSRENAAV